MIVRTLVLLAIVMAVGCSHEANNVQDTNLPIAPTQVGSGEQGGDVGTTSVSFNVPGMT